MPPPKATPNGASAPPSRLITASSTTLCEILPGAGTAPLSQVLDLLDLAAGRTAFRHVGRPTATASFERVRLASRIPRGALVRASARVIAVGNSSVLLRVQAEAEDVSTRTFRVCVTAYATFVALGEREEGEGGRRGRARVPAIAGVGAEEAEGGARVKERLARARAQVARITRAEAGELVIDRACCGPPDATEKLAARSAEVAFHKQYLPRHENFGGVVFGGDLFETMERVATYCGRRFARGRGRAQCVGVRFFNFVRPVEAMGLLCVRGRVGAVWGSVVYVEVRGEVDEGGEGGWWRMRGCLRCR